MSYLWTRLTRPEELMTTAVSLSSSLTHSRPSRTNRLSLPRLPVTFTGSVIAAASVSYTFSVPLVWSGT